MSCSSRSLESKGRIRAGSYSLSFTPLGCISRAYTHTHRRAVARFMPRSKIYKEESAGLSRNTAPTYREWVETTRARAHIYLYSKRLFSFDMCIYEKESMGLSLNRRTCGAVARIAHRINREFRVDLSLLYALDKLRVHIRIYLSASLIFERNL